MENVLEFESISLRDCNLIHKKFHKESYYDDTKYQTTLNTMFIVVYPK